MLFFKLPLVQLLPGLIEIIPAFIFVHTDTIHLDLDGIIYDLLHNNFSSPLPIGFHIGEALLSNGNLVVISIDC